MIAPLLVALATLQSPGPPAAPPSPSAPAPSLLTAARAQALSDAVTAAMAKAGIPGLSAAVAVNGQVRWTGAFGVSDVENDVPVKTSTMFRLASVTKPITATAILQLVERGRIDLAAPVQRYVPAFPEKPWPVTVRHLLCHQGGVRNWTEDEFKNTRRFATVADSLAAFAGDPLLFEPGTRTHYSSFGYNLLGAVIEGASGMPYLEYLRANVFEPARMESVRVDEVLAVIPNRAHGYQRGAGGEILNAPLSDVTNRVPGGGLAATAEDVARFAAALQRATLLRKSTVDAAFARQRTRDRRPTGYGFGWVVGEAKGRPEAYHLGGQPKVSTIVYMLPRAGVAVVLLANLEGTGPSLLDLARVMADAAAARASSP